MSPSSISHPPLKGLVLAGGKGTRLRPLTYSMAKQLVPVANRPILVYPMDSLYDAGITDIGVIISPETGDSVKETLDAWCPPDATLTYILQDAPAGLAHAVKTAEPFLNDSPFVMYLGDNLVQDRVKPLVDAFYKTQADAHILLKPVDNPQSFGVAEVNAEGKVIALVEKPLNPPSNLALVGVYLFQPKIFEAIHNIEPSARGELEITDAIQYLIAHGHHVESSVMQGWWLDTGKKDDLLAANQIVLDSYCQDDRRGTLENCQITGHVEIANGSRLKNCQLTGPIRIGENCVLEDSVIGPHTSIGDDCHIRSMTLSDSVILKQCHLSGLHGALTHSLIGQGCKIRFDQHTNRSQPEYQLMLGDENSWICT
jgi:glucose-1-phosphate thymidylyltransferase